MILFLLIIICIVFIVGTIYFLFVNSDMREFVSRTDKILSEHCDKTNKNTKTM